MRLAAPLVLVFALPAFAQEKPADKPRVDFDIEAEVSGAWRSDAIGRILDRDRGEDSEAFLAPRFTIRATATLPKAVTAVLEIENARLKSNLFDESTWGSRANLRVGDGDDLNAYLEQAYVRVNGLFTRDLSLKVGLQDFELALRGADDSFFADLQDSEFALASPITENVVAGSLYGAAPPEGTAPAGAGQFRDTCDAGGFRLTWNAFHRSLLFVDAFYFTTLEGGVRHADERFYGLNFDLLLPLNEETPGLVSLLLAGIENDRTGSQIWTVGLGVDFRPFAPAGLAIYAEAYWQSGRYAEPDDHRIRQSAWAGRAGARLPFDSLPLHPALDASFWVLTGDRGDPADHVNRDFVSYENIDEALVVEDDLYGLDIDSNYMSPRLRLSGSARIIEEGDLRFEVMYAYFRLWREPEKAGGSVELDPGRRLGHEVDVRVAWDINENASISIFGGALLDSQWLASEDAYGTRRRSAYVAGLAVTVGF